MQRLFTQDVTRPDGSTMYRKGERRDYPLETWLKLSQMLHPNARDHRKAIDKFSVAEEDLGQLIPDKKRKAA